MTGKQRYTAMLRGEPVDFVPRIPILMQFAAEHIGASYGAFCSDYRVKAEGNIRCAEEFGLDLVGVMSDPFSETQGYGAEIECFDHCVPACHHPPLGNSRDLSRLPRPNPLAATRMLNTVRVIETYQQIVGRDARVVSGIAPSEHSPPSGAIPTRQASRRLALTCWTWITWWIWRWCGRKSARASRWPATLIP